MFLIPLFSFSQTNFEKAEKLFNQEKYALAKPLFENELKDSPNHLKTIEHLGDISIHLNNLDKAISYYRMLIKLKPNEASFYYKYGGALGLKSQAGGKWVAIRLIGDMKASFEKAISLSTDKELSARATFMAARCEQKMSHVTKTANKRKYFALLKTKYKDTQYYGKVIESCKYFKYYVN